MIALLAYSLLERQARQQGVGLTARRILERLSDLQVIEVEARDGSRARRLSDLTPEQQALLRLVWRGVCGPAALPAPDPTAGWLNMGPGPVPALPTGPPRLASR